MPLPKRNIQNCRVLRYLSAVVHKPGNFPCLGFRLFRNLGL